MIWRHWEEVSILISCSSSSSRYKVLTWWPCEDVTPLIGPPALRCIFVKPCIPILLSTLWQSVGSCASIRPLKTCYSHWLLSAHVGAAHPLLKSDAMPGSSALHPSLPKSILSRGNADMICLSSPPQFLLFCNDGMNSNPGFCDEMAMSHAKLYTVFHKKEPLYFRL